ncbi:asparaginase family protein [Erythrobacter sp. NAP1]|uniref:asparaginase n=1 Tax=Erythrobacter sp. NAP1 TaxID=237727 RepID=UPI0000686B81|nr:asparaginase [Erythrobacter sp. NAP1]EAQ29368.1 asparaginase family protein [Erythrobacter sp. NAP1]
MTNTRILVLGTGGTIAGIAGDAMRHDYQPGQIGIDEWLEDAGRYTLDVDFVGRQIANVGSENMGPQIWKVLHEVICEAMEDDALDGIIVTHGTDTAEETAFLLDLTLPLTKPVVLVGAMRPADAVGSDGMRNFVNAVRVASAESSKGRGVLLVMGDRVLAARDARKVRTRGTDDAFRGFPRGSVAIVTPSALEWFGNPWRDDPSPRFAFPSEFPEVPILYAAGGIRPSMAGRLLEDAQGVVVAGVGEGNMPEAVRAMLAKRAANGLLVIRASRVDEGLVDREPEDDANRFVASRALNPQKSRILAMVLLANGVTDPAKVQAVFDRP